MYNVIAGGIIILLWYYVKKANFLQNEREYISFYILCVILFIIVLDGYINIVSDFRWSNLSVFRLNANANTYTSIYNYLQSVFAIPIALSGSIFAIFIAHKTYQQSEITKNLE